MSTRKPQRLLVEVRTTGTPTPLTSVATKYAYVDEKRFDVLAMTFERAIQDMVLHFGWEKDVETVKVEIKKRESNPTT